MKKIINILIIVLVILFVSNIIINYPQIRDYINIRKLDDKNKKDIKVLNRQNKNTLFKVKIPNTHIDYPVIRAKDNYYYLNHDINGNYNQYGSIFIDYREYINPFNFKNIIIYGHNMGRFNHLMFGDLMNYLNYSFFDKHKYIYIYQKKKEEKYKIVSVFKVKDTFLPYEIKWDSNNQFLEWQEIIKAKSMYSGLVNDFKISSKNSFITLSTCTYGDGKEKLVVIARLI